MARPDRARDRARERPAVRRGEEVWEDTVVHRRDADRDAGELGAEPEGRPSCASDARHGAGPGRGEHRAARVDDDPGGRVGARPHDGLRAKDRLRSGERKQSASEGQRHRWAEHLLVAKGRQPDGAARPHAAPGRDTERQERNGHDDRHERRCGGQQVDPVCI